MFWCPSCLDFSVPPNVYSQQLLPADIIQISNDLWVWNKYLYYCIASIGISRKPRNGTGCAPSNVTQVGVTRHGEHYIRTFNAQISHNIAISSFNMALERVDTLPYHFIGFLSPQFQLKNLTYISNSIRILPKRTQKENRKLHGCCNEKCTDTNYCLQVIF